MTQILSYWWTAISGYFIYATGFLRGDTGFFALLATAGIVCLILGLALCYFLKVPQVSRLWPYGIVALLTPFVIAFTNSILGWVGMLGGVLAGAVILLVGITITANNANRRLPIWVTGFSLIAFATVTAAICGAFDALVA